MIALANYIVIISEPWGQHCKVLMEADISIVILEERDILDVQVQHRRRSNVHMQLA
jgi:hypothetical protein